MTCNRLTSWTTVTPNGTIDLDREESAQLSLIFEFDITCTQKHSTALAQTLL